MTNLQDVPNNCFIFHIFFRAYSKNKWKVFWLIDRMHRVVVHILSMVIEVNVHIILVLGSFSFMNNYFH